MVEAVEAVLVVPVSHVEMEVHQLQQHLQAALASVIRLPELLRTTVAAAVHLGMEAQLVGLAQVASAVAGKEQMAQAQVRTELQTLVAVVAAVTTVQLVVTVGQVSSLFDMEFQLDSLHFHLT
jgi:hypothetical protein